MGWNIRAALNPIPEEGDYVMRVESVSLHVPDDDTKYPSALFKLKIISPEVSENMVEQATFRTLNPKWIKFLADDIANSNVINIDGNNDLDPSDYGSLVRELDKLFSGKTFVYHCGHGQYNGRPSANWDLVSPTSSY
jgi:hypothetical protein